ncbi:hypothetical protein GA0115259_112443 [Streptomyces sp. MnatMP-M17]|nr:hypothetical protein GA0115259_112443 [Streptomyces sp. MnatMP-M17]
MGAYDFITPGSDQDVENAFLGAKEEAAWEFGHGGYTGTIAEKSDFVLVADSPMSPAAAEKYAQHLLESDDERIRDKWGPAGRSRWTTAPGCSWATPPRHRATRHRRTWARAAAVISPAVTLRLGQAAAGKGGTDMEDPQAEAADGENGEDPASSRPLDVGAARRHDAAPAAPLHAARLPPCCNSPPALGCCNATATWGGMLYPLPNERRCLCETLLHRPKARAAPAAHRRCTCCCCTGCCPECGCPGSAAPLHAAPGTDGRCRRRCYSVYRRRVACATDQLMEQVDAARLRASPSRTHEPTCRAGTSRRHRPGPR